MSSQRLVDLRNHASIRTQLLNNIKTLLNRLMEEKSRVSKQGKSAVKTAKLRGSLNKLFDKALCQCLDFVTCRCDKKREFHDANNHF